jgi:hypothetical protein
MEMDAFFLRLQMDGWILSWRYGSRLSIYLYRLSVYVYLYVYGMYVCMYSSKLLIRLVCRFIVPSIHLLLSFVRSWLAAWLPGCMYMRKK